MDGHYKWCGFCCNLRYPLCCECKLCMDCCVCAPPPLTYYCPPEPLADLPCMGRAPPPIRVIREQVIVPIPYPVYPSRRDSTCLPKYCWDEGGDPSSFCRPPPPPTPVFPSCFGPQRYERSRGGCDPCRGDQVGVVCNRRYKEPGMVLENYHPCPWPSKYKRIHQAGESIMPGYKGHIPGLRYHGAGRSYGQATRDTCCIMSQWDECCPQLPCRIFEQ